MLVVMCCAASCTGAGGIDHGVPTPIVVLRRNPAAPAIIRTVDGDGRRERRRWLRAPTVAEMLSTTAGERWPLRSAPIAATSRRNSVQRAVISASLRV